MQAGNVRRSNGRITERREFPRHPQSSGDAPFIRERRSVESNPDILMDPDNPMVRERRTGLEKLIKTVTSFASSVAKSSKSFHTDPMGTLFKNDSENSQQSFADPDSDTASIQSMYQELKEASQATIRSEGSSIELPVIGADVSEMSLERQNKQLVKLLENSLDHQYENPTAALAEVAHRLENMRPEDVSSEVKDIITQRYDRYSELMKLI